MRLLNRLRRPDRLSESGQLPLELMRMYPEACATLDLLLVAAGHLAQRSLHGSSLGRIRHGRHTQPLCSLNGRLIQQSKPILSLRRSRLCGRQQRCGPLAAACGTPLPSR